MWPCWLVMLFIIFIIIVFIIMIIVFIVICCWYHHCQFVTLGMYLWCIDKLLLIGIFAVQIATQLCSCANWRYCYEHFDLWIFLNDLFVGRLNVYIFMQKFSQNDVVTLQVLIIFIIKCCSCLGRCTHFLLFGIFAGGTEDKIGLVGVEFMVLRFVDLWNTNTWD